MSCKSNNSHCSCLIERDPVGSCSSRVTAALPVSSNLFKAFPPTEPSPPLPGCFLFFAPFRIKWSCFHIMFDVNINQRSWPVAPLCCLVAIGWLGNYINLEWTNDDQSNVLEHKKRTEHEFEVKRWNERCHSVIRALWIWSIQGSPHFTVMALYMSLLSAGRTSFLFKGSGFIKAFI